MGRKLNNYLFKHNSILAKFLNVLIVFAIFVSISIIPLFFIYTNGTGFEKLFLVEKITVTLFISEFSLRILMSQKPHRYIFSKWGLINFLSVLPFFLYQFQIVPDFPTPLMLLRALRLLEFVKFPKVEEMEQQEIKQYEHFTILPGEKLLKIVQKHPLVFLSALSLPLFLTSAGIVIAVFFEFSILGLSIGLLFILLATIFYIKTWLDYRYDVLFITDYRIIVQERELFGTISDKINYESIAVIIPDTQGFFKMIFNFGHLIIRTPSDSTEVHFHFAPNVGEIAHLISKNRNRALQKHRPNNPQADVLFP